MKYIRMKNYRYCIYLDSHFVDLSLTGTEISIVVRISPLTAIMIQQKRKFLLKGISVGESQTDVDVIKRVLLGYCTSA